MSKRIYVGNLPFESSETDLEEMFAEFGTVDEVHLVTDRQTGRPRGFGFVEMSTGADEAIEKLNESVMGGRTLEVSEARARH